MKNFLWDWRYVIICLVLVVIAAIWDWERTKEHIFEAMLDAKALAQEGILKTGKAQEDWAVKMIFKLIPKPIAFFIREDSVRKLVKHFYKKSMDYLDDGKINNSFGNNENDSTKK